MKRPPSKGGIPPWFWIALSAVASAILFSALLAVNAMVPSASMEPTIRAGQMVFGWRPAYRLHGPARGDIVLFRHPSAAGELLVKRVVALEGDVVEITEGTVLLNGAPLAEPYALPDQDQNAPAVTVPRGCCYLLGDNRAASRDSSEWTEPFVPFSELVAKVLWIYG